MKYVNQGSSPKARITFYLRFSLIFVSFHKLILTVKLLSVSSSDSENETTDWKISPEQQGKKTPSLPGESMIHKVSFQLLLLFLYVYYLLLYLYYLLSVVTPVYLMF